MNDMSRLLLPSPQPCLSHAGSTSSREPSGQCWWLAPRLNFELLTHVLAAGRSLCLTLVLEHALSHTLRLLPKPW